jgi:ribonucleoside-triphosphate reductase
VVEKRADDLKFGDYILQNSDNLYSEKDNELTDDLMWLLGYFMADNNILEVETAKAVNYAGGQSVYNFQKKEEHLFKARSIINFHFKNDLNQLKSRARYSFSGNKKNSVNNLFLKNLFPFEEHSFKSEIPEEIKSKLNSKNVYSLIKGMFDSSGFINDSEGYAEYYTNHEKFADDLLEICSIAGISAYKKEQSENIFNGENNFIIRMPLMEIMKLKAESRSFIEEIKSGLDYSKNSAKKISAVKVKNTDKVNVEDNMFYDLSTEKNHNYLAGKNTLVFIHNTVLHGFLGENMPSVKSTKKLVRRIAENFKLPYYTITPTFSICPIHGYIAGEHQYCPKCDAEAAAAEDEENGKKEAAH